MNSTALLFLAASVALAGCAFPGNVGFESLNERPIWVARVDGFDRPVGAGILSKGAKSYSYMGPMKYPKEVTLHWSYEWHKSDYSTTLYTKDTRFPYDDDRLIFLFTEEGEWKIVTKRRNEK